MKSSSIQTEHAFNLQNVAGEKLTRLPFSIRILLENALRNGAYDQEATQAVDAILNWQP